MPPDSLILVHLSDIHFKKRRVDGTYDTDLEIRNELELSLQQLLPTLGSVRGVVVTGDIAYAGDPREYEAAEKWLTKICKLIGCPPESVWTAPGNHDVDREVVNKSQVVQLLQANLRKDPDRLEKLQQDAQAAAALFSPLAAYNEFAQKRNCDIGPDRLLWWHNLPLNDGSTLRLFGLNSTLTSCKLDDEGQRLVLGDMSHALLREYGVAFVSLCHHPPDWLLDHDQVTSLLNTRTRLQLFGHKHLPRIERVNDSLVVTAGAVHPDRDEKKWEPRYNVIECRVNTSGSTRELEVIVHAMVWSTAKREFVPDTTDPNANVPILLPLEPWAAPVVFPPAVAVAPVGPVSSSAPDNSPRAPAMDAARRLTYRFLTLPFHDRMAIGSALGLLRDEDQGVTDRVLFERFFKRAADEGLLAKLWSEVEKRHIDAADSPNPYAGR